MISESLRPSPLPRRRLNAQQWVLILAGCALLGAGFFVVGIPGTSILLISLCIGAACVRRFETAFVLLLGVSMSISFDTLLDLRPGLEGTTIPVNILDFLAFLVLCSIILNLVGRQESLALPRNLLIPYLLFILVTLFGLVYGILVNSGSINTFLRDARLFFTLHLCILGVAWFIRSPRQLRLIAYTLVLAGFLCACQQNWRFVSMGSQGFVGIRDVTLPAPVFAFAITFLLIYRYHGIRLCPPNTYPFLLSFILISLLVSFTRSVWAMMIISYALSIQFMGAKQRARSIFLAMGIFGTLIFVVPFAVDLASHDMNLQSLMEERFQQIMGKNDIARQVRFVTTADAWMQYIGSPIWGYGLGYPIIVYDPAVQSTSEDQNLHNSPLFYGIKIGAIGVLVLTWLIIAPLMRTLRAATASNSDMTAEQKEAKAFSQALFASFIPFAGIGIWSGNLNYNVFMPILGLTIGLFWDRILNHYKTAATSSAPPANATAPCPTPSSLP